MILMERGLHSPTTGKRFSNLSDSAGNAVLEALENSQHPARLSPRLPSAPLHSALGDLPAKGKFEIDTLFNLQHPSSESTVSSEIASAAEGRKKPGHYSEAAAEADMSSDVEVGCSALRSPGGLGAVPLKENNGKGNRAARAALSSPILSVPSLPCGPFVVPLPLSDPLQQAAPSWFGRGRDAGVGPCPPALLLEPPRETQAYGLPSLLSRRKGFPLAGLNARASRSTPSHPLSLSGGRVPWAAALNSAASEPRGRAEEAF